MSNTQAVVTYNFHATPEKVFDAWINPEKIKQWMFPNGNMIKCENNPEVGGYFIFVDRRDGEDIQHIGHYLELEHPNHMKFTWATVDDLPDADYVTIEINASENGSEVILTHEVDANWAEYLPQTKNAWTKMFEAMAKVLR